MAVLPPERPVGARLYGLEPYHFSHNLAPDARTRLTELFAGWPESDEAWAPVKAALDHRYLNDVPGLSKITLQETATSGCVYTGA